MSNKKINVGALEFDQIKQNLKTFLQGQDRFSDYDFEGSNLSILLDVLAYNTHYNALYVNMAVNEAFLDSASKRNSVVSLAKALGYTPRSSRAAKGRISFAIANIPLATAPEFLTLPKNTKFTGMKDSVRYTFNTTTAITKQRNASGQYQFDDVEIIEGTWVATKFEYTDKNAFKINNANIDTSTMVVRVQDSASSTSFETYTLADSLSDITTTSNVYFLREADDGFFEISFGNGIIGKKPNIGSIINVEYYSCNREEPNDISSITYSGASLLGGNVVSLTVIEPINGGDGPEATEDIRFNAPNIYAAQNRAVTSQDYEALLRSKVPEIDAVTVWGGENNNPPVYGKVFISAKTKSGRDFTYAEQQSIIKEVIDPVKVVTIIPEFVDASYIELEVDAVVYYDKTQTILDAEAIRTRVMSAIITYNDNDLKLFNKIFRSSVLARAIEDTEQSIVSSVIRLKIYRNVSPVFNVSNKYDVNLGNPIVPKSFKTNGFYTGTTNELFFIEDDGNGTLKMFSNATGVKQYLQDVGSVSYASGRVIIDGLYIANLESGNWVWSCVPSSADVASVYNQIVIIDPAKIKINIIADDTANGRAIVGTSYQFSANRLQ